MTPTKSSNLKALLATDAGGGDAGFTLASAPLRTPLELHSLGSGRPSDPDEPDSLLQPDQRNALLSVELNDTVVEDMISPAVVHVD